MNHSESYCRRIIDDREPADHAIEQHKERMLEKDVASGNVRRLQDRHIEPNVELVGLHDAGLDRVLNALDRPSVGRSASAREYAERYAAKLRQPSIVPKPVTVNYAHPMLNHEFTVTRAKSVECHQCGHEFAPFGVHAVCHRCGAKWCRPSIAPKPMGDDVEMSRPDRFEQE